MKKENAALRKMKDASEVKAVDYEQMDEWDSFMDVVEKVKEQLKPLSHFITSNLYHNRERNTYGGFIGEQEDLGKLKAFENEGYIK